MKFQVKRKGLFSIGELATVFHVTPGTIRHYESLGLLKPSFVDPETNYRFYEFSRLEVLHTIRYLRSLGMTLEAIGRISKGSQRFKGYLNFSKLKKMEIAAKQRELKITKRKLERRIQSIKDALGSPIDEIQLVTLDKQKFLLLETKLVNPDNDDLEMAVQELEKIKKTHWFF